MHLRTNVGLAMTVSLLLAACLGGSGDDQAKDCTDIRKGDAITTTVDHDTLCAAEKDGSLALTYSYPSSFSPVLRPADEPAPSAANRDLGLPPAKCATLCGDAKYEHCVIAGQYDAFKSTHEASATTCKWADTKPTATLTCYELERVKIVCSGAVG